MVSDILAYSTDADTQPPPSTDPKINTLLATIQSERRNLEGAKAVVRAVEASSRNEAVIQQAQNEVRAAQASIKFLEDELAKLQVGSGSGSPMRDGAQQNPGYPGARLSGVGPPGVGPGGGYPGSMMTPSKSSASLGSSQSAMSPSPSKRPGGGDYDRPLPPPPPGEQPSDQVELSKGQKNYTQLGKLASHHKASS